MRREREEDRSSKPGPLPPSLSTSMAWPQTDWFSADVNVLEQSCRLAKSFANQDVLPGSGMLSQISSPWAKKNSHLNFVHPGGTL